LRRGVHLHQREGFICKVLYLSIAVVGLYAAFCFGFSKELVLFLVYVCYENSWKQELLEAAGGGVKVPSQNAFSK
jgi:hypothetical protein